MKKVLASLSVLAIVAVSTSSCSKIVEQIFPGIDTRLPDINVTIPMIPVVPANEISLGTYTTHFNLDSTIKANTSGVFDIGVVSSVKVKEISVSVSNADNLNNLSNFDYARFALGSNNSSEPANVTTINFPESNSSSVTVTPDDSPELLNLLKGSELTYTLYGKARRPTIKPLKYDSFGNSKS